ncbi:hypothetical protein [Acinetobacter sp.]|nr:hypothetical protein [Acinetobacter sp.]MDN5511963.1 hypothetical protein [Acinetobacter sp.]MDN5524866.1 hypothetical protein [Acinetobacter sp.]
MVWLIAKYAITAGMVILISEVAKRSDRVGGIDCSLTYGNGTGADMDEN